MSGEEDIKDPGRPERVRAQIQEMAQTGIDISHLPPLFLKIINDFDLKAFMAVSGGKNPESAKIALHKLRANVRGISDMKRIRSMKWLRKRGYEIDIDLEVDRNWLEKDDDAKTN
jgi:hypothetical protein